ncbi:MAG: DUF6261 family protein [Paludibacter sp.]
MITSLNFSLFPSKELFTFGKNTLSIAETKKGSIIVIEPFLNNAKTRLATFQSAMERESKNPLIITQSEQDSVRIDAFMTFRNAAESATTRRKEGVSAAGIEIVATIRKHTWTIQTLGQKARTAVLNNIISEIKTKHAAQLILIGGTELMEELEQAQHDYETASTQVVESASENNEPTVGESRPELIAALKALFQIISLQEIAAPSADVIALIAALNELIINSLSTVKASGTRAENAKKKADDSKTGTATN